MRHLVKQVKEHTSILPERFLFHVLEYIRIEKCRQIDFKAVADFLNRGHVGGIVPAVDDIADR